MALIVCPKCWKRISDYSEKCPYCGYTIWKGPCRNGETKDGAYDYSQTTSQLLQYGPSHHPYNNQEEKPTKKQKRTIWIVIVIVVLLIASYIEANTSTSTSSSSTYGNTSGSYSSSSYSSSSNDSSDKKTIAQLHAEAFVKKYLKSPSTAKFPSYNEYSYTYNGNQWTVSGYVDAQNSYGATLRQNFTVSFTVSSSDWYNATLDSIDID